MESRTHRYDLLQGAALSPVLPIIGARTDSPKILQIVT